MHAIVAGIFLIQLILRDFVIGGGLVGINRFTGFRSNDRIWLDSNSTLLAMGLCSGW